MNSIPFDCLIEILRFVPFQELIRVGGLNKTFNSLIKETEWNQEVTIHNENDIKYLAENYKFFRCQLGVLHH
jgi:hypothetical protein